MLPLWKLSHKVYAALIRLKIILLYKLIWWLLPFAVCSRLTVVGILVLAEKKLRWRSETWLNSVLNWSLTVNIKSGYNTPSHQYLIQFNLKFVWFKIFYYAIILYSLLRTQLNWTFRTFRKQFPGMRIASKLTNALVVGSNRFRITLVYHDHDNFVHLPIGRYLFVFFS